MIALPSFSSSSSCPFSPQFWFWKSFNFICLCHRHLLCQNIWRLLNNSGLLKTICQVANLDKKRRKNWNYSFFGIWPCLTEVQANVNERSSSLSCDMWSLKNIYFSFPPWKAWVQADPYIKIYQRKSFDGTLKWKKPCDWASDVLKLKNIVQLMFQCLRV